MVHGSTMYVLLVTEILPLMGIENLINVLAYTHSYLLMPNGFHFSVRIAGLRL